MTKFISQYVIKPGATLKETLYYLGMSQAELALRCKLSEKTITEIINGECAITIDTALKLEKVLDIEASFWINLEKKYRENKARKELIEAMEHEKELAKNFSCYLEMVKRGLVKKTQNTLERTEELLRFFGVNSLDTVSTTQEVAFKISSKKKISKESLAAWLRWGEKEALKIELPNKKNPINKTAILELKKYIFTDPKDSYEQVKDLCKEMGIAYVYLPYFKKTYVNGATKWIGDKAMVQLSNFYQNRDSFWFAFFHELGHVHLHGKKGYFVEVIDPLQNGNLLKLEKEANDFASNILINKTNYDEFIMKKQIKDSDIREFSQKNNIPVDIVAGRLAHDGILDWSKVSHLRVRLSELG